MLSLDLPISFLHMSKHCSISLIYSQSNKFIFWTIHFSFTQLYEMPLLSSFNQAKQKPSINKPELWLFDTFSTKNVARQHGFIPLVSFNACTLISYSIIWPFIFNVLSFSSIQHQYSTFHGMSNRGDSRTPQWNSSRLGLHLKIYAVSYSWIISSLIW